MTTSSVPPPTIDLTFVPDHFEPDTHLLVKDAAPAAIQVLPGETELEDITVVTYSGIPALSFYDVYGRLVDVDHYLPDNYAQHDAAGAESLLATLRLDRDREMKQGSAYGDLLREVLDSGQGSLAAGLRIEYGLQTDGAVEQAFLDGRIKGGEDLFDALHQQYRHMQAFLLGYLNFQLSETNQYVHFTPQRSIIITCLNKDNGIAVMIETRDEQGRPLKVRDWRITRTHTPAQLSKALVFRTKDIQAFFSLDNQAVTLTSQRYSLQLHSQYLLFDSLMDGTENLLKVPMHKGCYQVLVADPDVVVVLSGAQELSIVNTHRSVIPKKWLDTIKLPEETLWVRTDENLQVAFCLLLNQEVVAYNIAGDQVVKLGEFRRPVLPGFSLDQTGALTLIAKDSHQLLRLASNVNDLQLPGQEATFSVVFNNLSHLFKGKNLFNKAVYATKVTEDQTEVEDRLPTAIEVARFDFDTSIDHLLAAAGDDYTALLGVLEKLAIARQNIAEEFATVADTHGVRLVGQRLQQTINNIVRPSERRVTGLVQSIRAQQLLESARGLKEELGKLTDPSAYRDGLNTLRSSNDELIRMAPENTAAVMPEFREIQGELTALFSRQISEDGTALQTFITTEIDQIEEAIQYTHEPRKLEALLSTHPAAIELMSLLKQPFVLQSIAEERKLSPAGIQSRLYEAVENQLAKIKAEDDRKEAERNAAKIQLAGMAREAIDFFITHHGGGFSDLELSSTASYQAILKDVRKLEHDYGDTRLAGELRQRLERVILDKNRESLVRAVAFEGKYAFVQNDPDLFVDLESTVRRFPEWRMELIEKNGSEDHYQATFIRDSDREVFRPSTSENLLSGRAFEIDGKGVSEYLQEYQRYVTAEYELATIEAVWSISNRRAEAEDFPQFAAETLADLAPQSEAARRALGAAREKKRRDRLERTRHRNVPTISPEFIDETPYFQSKLREFFIKAKLQLGTGSGVLLLSGPPSTGKSAFLKFAAALMNREYFEHASDKWQTKNSLVTAVRFGENGPYTTPAGFTRAITTAHSLINIEELKEWPEALRKSLNPFFAGSKEFVAPDGTSYRIGDNILLCGAANLGSMYRLEDEAFTADFWSRIEVVEYDYAPHQIDEDYYGKLHEPVKHSFLTMQDLVRYQFNLGLLETDLEERAKGIARQLVSFLILPKADDSVKRDRLQQELTVFFSRNRDQNQVFGPEEAAKVALRRVKDLQGFTASQFFDLYDHFINGRSLRSPAFTKLQSTNLKQYKQLQLIFLSLWYLEGSLRHIRDLFVRSGGQSEIEGTNREFISSVYLLGLLGDLR